MICPLRISEAIPLNAAQNLVDAVEYAFHSGWPLNRFITIHFDVAGVADDQAHRFITTFLARAGDWLGTVGVKRAYIWILENPPNGGLHWHLLVHVPPRLISRFNSLQRGWLKTAGGSRAKGVMKTKRVGGQKADVDRVIYLHGIEGLMKYLLKGAETDVCWPAGVDHKFQGFIHGKRCGTSESIGLKARTNSPPTVLRSVGGKISLRKPRPLIFPSCLTRGL